MLAAAPRCAWGALGRHDFSRVRAGRAWARARGGVGRGGQVVARPIRDALGMAAQDSHLPELGVRGSA